MKSRLGEALQHLEQGKWEAAHVIVQEDESKLASWMHAIVHLQEGDSSNANYWFRRAGQASVGVEAIGQELAKIRTELEGG